MEDEEGLVVLVVILKQEGEFVGEEEYIVGGEEGATAAAIGRELVVDAPKISINGIARRELGSPIKIGHGTVV